MQKEIMWFEEGFDQKIKQFIDSNPLPYADLNCFEMSHRYAERFIAAGIPVVLCSGFYLGDEWRGDRRKTLESLNLNNFEHYWLLVDGLIFDPTAGQWQTIPRKEYLWADESDLRDEEAIVDWLGNVERPETHGQGGDVEDWAKRLQEHIAKPHSQRPTGRGQASRESLDRRNAPST